MSMRLRRTVAATVAVAVMAIAGAAAPVRAVSAKVKKACAGDYKRLCPSYKVGSPALRACMEAKQAEITSKCVDALIASGEVNRSAKR